jgi:hypothetical protein
MKNMFMVIGLLLALGWVIDMCDGPDEYDYNGSSSSSSGSSEESDLACDHFRNVTRDVGCQCLRISIRSYERCL